jgi:RNA polymerase sigma-70 factor (ECF subfamily)
MARSGPAAAKWIESAVRLYEGRLVSYVTRIVGDDERARDVVQDTFLRLWQEDWVEVEPRLAEWLYTVCRNRALDVRRREGRMGPISATEERGWREGSSGADPFQALHKKESEAHAMAMLARLPANQQEVLRLKFQGGLSYQEISQVTGLSVSNVGFLIHTGLKSLRERMGVTTEVAAK